MGRPSVARRLTAATPRGAQLVLDVESKELGISAGLQDRVVQWYGGLCHMDFTSNGQRDLSSAYTNYPVDLLPPLYLAYNVRLLGDSGKVHSPVRDRFANGDPVVVAGMAKLAENTDLAVKALHTQDFSKLADLMEENFALRRSMYGDEAVGARNIELTQLAKAHGLAAKFTGSGGACVCLKRPSGTAATPSSGRHALQLSKDEEASLRVLFAAQGFQFVRIRFDDDGSGGGRSPIPLRPVPSSQMEVRGAVLQID